MRLFLTEADVAQLPSGPEVHHRIDVNEEGLAVKSFTASGTRSARDFDRATLLAFAREGELRIKDDHGRDRLPDSEAAVHLVRGPSWAVKHWLWTWWFDLTAATLLYTWPEPCLGTWMTSAGRYVVNHTEDPTRWESMTPDEACSRFYRIGRNPQLSDFDETHLPGDLALVVQLGRMVRYAETAWGPGTEAWNLTRGEAEQQVEGLPRVMEFMKTEALPDLRRQRTAAARRVQTFHRTQTEAARSMNLDKSTWTSLLNRPAREPQTGGPTPKE
ncbi:hypothetical protein ACWCQL_13800 [Streptomyces sp. NPDC002073]